MANTTVNVRFKICSKTKAEWEASTDKPLLGELCFEKDTNKLKIGSGAATYSELDYVKGKILTEEIDTVISEETKTSLKVPTTKAVYDAIAEKIAASDAMVFKGTVGEGGTVSDLPTTNVVVGDTYKVSVAGTYAEQEAKVGDLFIAETVTGNNIVWAYIPSGDDSQITEIAVVSGDLTLTGNGVSGLQTLGLAVTTVAAGSYGDTTDQTPDPGDTFKVPSFTVDAKGRLTEAGEHTITLPADEKVKYNSDTTTNAAIPFVMAGSNAPTDNSVNGVKYSDITYNPSTKTIGGATNFTGKAATAGTADFLGSTDVGGTDTPVYLDDGEAKAVTNINANLLTQDSGDFLVLDGNFF